uniref:Uncharacterized protein n=1 Tax=Desertifilum tharense IPPAS B-1220 TaxID=1781255 RepID=A0ACD5GSN5_9CYAN
MREHRVLFPPNPLVQRSEFLLPLSEESAQQYLRYWEEMRSQPVT